MNNGYSGDLQQLAADVQMLKDRQSILDCIYRYCRGLDRHDDDLLRSAFHPDAIDNHGAWVGGMDEFIPWANHEVHNNFRAHSHNITCHFADIEGDVAHTESYVIFALHKKDGSVVNVGGGRYVDRFDKRNGEWKISLRRLIVDWRFEAGATAWDGGRPPYPAGTWDRNDPSYQRPLKLPPQLEEMLKTKRN